MDRPGTQQSLAGLRAGTAYGQSRQVFDKRYYEGLLRTKIKAISNEVHELNTGIDAQRQQGSTAQIYETRVKVNLNKIINQKAYYRNAANMKIQAIQNV